MKKLVKKNTERAVVEAYFHALTDCCNASGGGSTAVGGAGSGNSGNSIGSGNGNGK